MSFIVNAFGLVQTALLRKRLEFKTLAIGTSAGMLVSGPVGVVLAVHGYGVWSLVAQRLCATWYARSSFGH